MPHRPRALCGVALILALLLGWAAAPARAQSAPADTAAPAAAPVSAAELQSLVDSLQDPAARQKLVEELQGLIAAQRSAQEKTPPAPGFLEQLSRQADAATDEVLAATQLAFDAPLLMTWLGDQASDPAARTRWLEIVVKLAFTFGVGLAAEWLVRLALRRAAARLAAWSGVALLPRLAIIALSIVVALAPVLVFAAAAALALPFTEPAFATRQVARVTIGAILWARGVLAVCHILLLSPSASTFRWIGDETRNYLYIWARRFINWTFYGYAVAAAAWWLGVPGAVYALLLRVTVLVLAVLAIIFVLQNRRPVMDWLRGPADSVSGWTLVRNRIADIWHVLTTIILLGAFGVFVLDIEGGYFFLVRATALTFVVLLSAALIVNFVDRLNQHGFAIGPELKARYPTLEARANRYLPAVYYLTAAAVYVFATFLVLQAWSIHAFAWLVTEGGRRMTSSAVTIAIVVVVALIFWEAFSAAIERYLAAADGDGRPLARSNRARTLLPLLRTTLFIVIVIMVGLTVLSEVGLNITPLLAGAGVLGLAIGVGSQALVKDVITGFFILVEDTLAVGEMVDVGKASGIVESLTIRTIRIRDQAGTLNTIPFSDVTTVRNMTRDYAYAVHDVGVLYREDPDRVSAVLRAVAEEMAADPEWKWRILDAIEIFGLDRFTDTAQIIRVRLKTAPLQQWAVQREYNRRMKKAFDQHGIEMPAMNQTHYLPEAPRTGA